MTRLRERLGMVPPPRLRVDEVSPRLRTAAWNLLYEIYLSHTQAMQGRVKGIVEELGLDLSQYYGNQGILVEHIKGQFRGLGSWEFYEVLDVVARGFAGLAPQGRDYWKAWNKVLIDEGGAFRFVNGELVPVTNEAEIREIETALKSPLQTVREHIDTALKKLAERPEPDVRNAIKEAISAVEGTLKVTTGRAKGDLTDALPEFEARFGVVHGAFRVGIEKFYAFTSDEKGIRHSLLEADVKVDLDDARFMVIACSALCNFLVARAAARGWAPK
jgi:hypothetical protein